MSSGPHSSTSSRVRDWLGQERRITILGYVHAYGSACFFVFGLIYWVYVSSLYMLVSNCVFGTLCALNWVAHRRLGHVRFFTTSFLVTVYLGLVNVAVHLGVHSSPLIYWGLSVLIAAAFIYNLWGIAIWTAISLGFYPLCLFLKRGLFAHRAIPLDAYQVELLETASYIGLGLFLGYTCLLFQRKLNRTLVKLEDRSEELKRAHDGLERRVEERTAELSRANQELHESERLVGAIVDNIPDMVFLKTAEDLRYVRLNPAGEKLLGLRQEEVVGMTDHDLFDPEEADFFQKTDRAALDGGALVEIPQDPVNTRDRGPRILRTKKVPVLGDDQQPRFLLGISEDITESLELAEQSRLLDDRIQNTQKLESLGVLAGGIAHDFNNLLAVISGNLELAEQATPAGTPVKRNLASARTGVRRATDLVSQVLAYSGKGRLVSGDVDLNTLVQEMTGLVESSLSPQTTLRFLPQEHLPPARGDATQIRQVILNLLTNADEALGDTPGEITIATSDTTLDREALDALRPDEEIPAGRYVQLEIRDTGPGLDEAAGARVFEPFYTTKAKGSGLGLAVVHGIVRSHRGAITVQSEPGQGTQFTVLLPAVIRSVSTEISALTTAPWRGEGKVLVVDDEELVRLFARDALEGFGYEVLLAADGHEAVTLFHRHAEGLVCVLLDWRMPEMDGEQVFAELRRIRAQVPVLLCSGFADEEATTRMAIQGLAGFLQKPYTIASLGRMLRAVLTEDAAEEAPEEPQP